MTWTDIFFLQDLTKFQYYFWHPLHVVLDQCVKQAFFFQIVAKFGMMHIIATNACIVIRTLVKESSKEMMGHDDKAISSNGSSSTSAASSATETAGHNGAEAFLESFFLLFLLARVISRVFFHSTTLKNKSVTWDVRWAKNCSLRIILKIIFIHKWFHEFFFY